MEHDRPALELNTPVPIMKAPELFFPFGGVNVSTLRAACLNGELSYAKISGRYLVTKADINAWVQRCRVEQLPRSASPTREYSNQTLPQSDRNAELAKKSFQHALEQGFRHLRGFRPRRRPSIHDIPDYDKLTPTEQSAKLDELWIVWKAELPSCALIRVERKALQNLMRFGVNKPVRPSKINIAPTALEMLEIRGFISVERKEATLGKAVTICITNAGVKGLSWKPPTE